MPVRNKLVMHLIELLTKCGPPYTKCIIVCISPFLLPVGLCVPKNHLGFLSSLLPRTRFKVDVQLSASILLLKTLLFWAPPSLAWPPRPPAGRSGAPFTNTCSSLDRDLRFACQHLGTHKLPPVFIAPAHIACRNVPTCALV